MVSYRLSCPFWLKALCHLPHLKVSSHLLVQLIKVSSGLSLQVLLGLFLLVRRSLSDCQMSKCVPLTYLCRYAYSHYSQVVVFKLHHRRPQTGCVFSKSEHSATRACDVQSWETKDCKAEAATAVQSWETDVDTGRQV